MSKPTTPDEWRRTAFEHFRELAEAGVEALQEHREGVAEAVASRIGPSLDAFDLAVAVARSMAATYPNLDGDEEPRINALKGIHERACDVAGEIGLLVRHGFDEGAWSRGRTLHEARVIATFLAAEPAERSQLFLAWGVADMWRNYVNYSRSIEEAGGIPVVIADVDEFKASATHARDFVRDKLGTPKAEGSYGWIASPGNQRPTFADLERQANLIGARSWYLLANHAVHVSAAVPVEGRDTMSLDEIPDDVYASLEDCLLLGADCLRAVTAAVSGMCWHPDENVADTINPLVMAIEEAASLIGRHAERE